MSDTANITMHKIFVIAEPPQLFVPRQRQRNARMGVPSIDQFHRWKGCKRQIYCIARSRQPLRAEFMGCPAGHHPGIGGALRQFPAPSTLDAVAGKRASEAVGCASSDADGSKVWSGGALQRGSGKPSEA
jgi:hypothetical protein